MQKFFSRLFSRLMKGWSWVLLILGAIAIKWVSLYPNMVEKYYTYGFYPIVSRLQRTLFGWIPFSIGDLFYGFLILLLLFRVVRFFRFLFLRRLNRAYFKAALQHGIFLFLFIYVFFNLLWGLNYNRLGISSQLGLTEVSAYSTGELDSLVKVLHTALNNEAAQLTPEARDSFARDKYRLFRQAGRGYDSMAQQQPYLAYQPRSAKPSLFSYAGNILGFQGYYNPFSGEAQVNTTIPSALEPFVTMHEIAHQLGYGKENEANFVAFLASRRHPSVFFRYSVYFDMYQYAGGELYRRDSAALRAYNQALHPQVKADIKAYRDYLKKYKNPIEPVITWAYGSYLKANNQPGGKRTYSEVVAWLIAYYRKFQEI